MAAYDFPDTAGKPTDGSFDYTAPDGTLYEWNGYAWVVPTDESGGGSGGAARVLTQVLPPSPAEDGDMYWCTDDGRLYLYYDDADTKQWVDASPDGGGNNVEKLIAGDNITLSPANGKGVVTINSTGGGGGPTTPGVRYQKGTWTPVPTEGDIEAARDPSRWVWSRVGNTVTISAYVAKLTGTGNSVISFDGAPYLADAVVSGSASGNRISKNSLGITCCYIRGQIDNQVQFLCSTQTTADAWEQPRYDDKGENNGIYFSVTYLTDDTTFVPINGATVTEDIQGTGGGGGGGGGSTDIYGTSKAWAKIYNTGSIARAYNIDRVEVASNGNVFTCFFTEPMPYADYVVEATVSSTGSGAARVRNQTVDSFDVVTSDWDGSVLGLGFGVTVHDNEPVTVSGGGGGTTVNYNGASAWGSVAADGTLEAGLNCTVANTAPGNYTVTFLTPISGAYSVVTGGRSSVIQVRDKTATYFKYETRQSDGSALNIEANFAVHSANAIAPQSGVGADAWGSFLSSGSILGSFNTDSVTKSNTGVYVVTFTTPMPNASYSALATPQTDKSMARVASKSTTGFSIYIYNQLGNAIDANCNYTIHASSTVTPTYTWTRDGTTLKPANDGDDVDLGNIQLNADGMADFGGTIKSNTFTTSSDTGSGFRLTQTGNLRMQVQAGTPDTSSMMVFNRGSGAGGEVVKITADGKIQAKNVTFNLEADDDTKYTATTDSEGEQTLVYNGATLDVKALLLNLQTAAARITTLEETNASLEARLTALEGGNN